MKENITDKEDEKHDKIGLEDTILGNSSSMLGFCFVVISYLNATNLGKKTIVDELTMVAMVAFMANCVFSFLSVRRKRFQTRRFINFTSYVFMSGLIILFGIVILIAFGYTDAIW